LDENKPDRKLKRKLLKLIKHALRMNALDVQDMMDIVNICDNACGREQGVLYEDYLKKSIGGE